MKSKNLWQYISVVTIIFLLVSTVNAQWMKQQVLNPLDSFATFYPNAVKFVDANTGYLGGGGNGWFGGFPGVIFKTTNGGNNWSQTSLSTAYQVWYMDVVNSTTVYISCDSAQVIRTITGGSTWTVLNTPAVPSLTVRWRISFLNALTGWITSNDAGVNKTYQTTNGGTSWAAVNSSSGFSKIKFISASNGLGLNSSGFYTSANGGVSWTNTLTDSLLTDYYFLNNNTGWLFSKKSSFVSSIKGKSWKTTNGGANWNLLYSNDTTGYSPADVIFFDDLTGYAAYRVNNSFPSGIIKTTNGGVNWFNPTDYRLGSTNNGASFSAFINQSTGWYGMQYDYIYKTSTGIGNLVNPFFADYIKIQNSNNLSSYTDARGGLTAPSPLGSNLPGLEYPKGSNNHCLFNSSIAISAVVNGDTLLSQGYNGSDFRPGQFIGGNEVGSRLGEYGLYQIKTGDGTGVPDYDRWPVSQGAPVSGSQPMLTGNQSTFVTLTDMTRSGFTGETAPLKAEVKIYSYSFNDDLRKDAIYYKIDITNKNSAAWNNAMVSFIVDTDIGSDPADDKMGCDSALGLAYGYNGSGSDPGYGTTPPATGYKFISGTGAFKLNSCVPFYNISPPPPNTCWGDPGSVSQFINYQKGLDRCGEAYTFGGLPRKFVFNGDPETNTGWNSTFGADARYYMNIGPSNLAPGETATIVVAVLVARGSNAKNSVTKLKQYAAVLPVNILPVNTITPVEFRLNQNFPNPFNPVTKISYSLPKASFMELNVYDISGRLVKNLFSGRHAEGNYEMDFNGESLSSGIYICRMNSENYTNSIKMILVK